MNMLAVLTLMLYECRYLFTHLCLQFLSSAGSGARSPHTPVGSATGVQAGVCTRAAAEARDVCWGGSLMGTGRVGKGSGGWHL